MTPKKIIIAVLLLCFFKGYSQNIYSGGSNAGYSYTCSDSLFFTYSIYSGGSLAGANATCAQNLYFCSLVANVTSTNVSCNGGSDGTVSVNISGGVCPYSYSWDSGMSSTETLSGFSSGTYTITTSDFTGCEIFNTVTITEPTLVTPSILTQTDATCYGNSDGTASLSVSGGTSGYNYLWPSGATTSSIANLTAATHEVSISDANGCLTTIPVTISEPLALTASTTCSDVSFVGGNDGHSSTIASGGTSGYTYLWNINGNNQTTSTATGLSAGNPSVTITDANGCSMVESCAINEPLCSMTSNISSTNVSCNNGSDGTATVNVQGGTSGFTYNWSSGGTLENETNLNAGTYSVTVGDANNCTSVSNTTITEPSAISIAVLPALTTVCSETAITISSTVSGGTSPYTYLWSNNDTISEINPVITANTTFSLTLTDHNGCSGVQSTIPIIVVQPPEITGSGPHCQNETSIHLNANPADGIWSGAGVIDSINGILNPSSLDPGFYQIIFTAFGTCQARDTIVVEIHGTPIVTANISDESCIGNVDGEISLTPSGNKTSYNYSWDNNSITEDVTGLSPGIYTVSVTDNDGCMIFETYEVKTAEAPCIKPHIFIPNGFSPDGDGENDILFVRGKGIENFILTIYDRWGGKVFETTNLDIGWDGTYKSERLNTAVFVYYITGMFEDGTQINEKGNITLLR